MKRISQIIISVFLFLMMFIIVKNTVLSLVYELNTNLFIEMFCENIRKPDLNCDGKCMLAKMQNEQNKQEAENVLKQLQTEVVFFNLLPIYTLNKVPYKIEDALKEFPIYTSLYTFLFTPTFINPPRWC